MGKLNERRKNKRSIHKRHARVAELVDALALGASPRKRVGVRIPPLAPQCPLRSKKEIIMEQSSTMPPIITEQQNSLSTYPAQSTNPLMTFKFISISSHLMKIKVEVSAEVTNLVYNETISFFSKKQFEGFNNNQVPNEYLESTFNAEITKKVKSYLYRHHVVDALIAEISAQKIPYANYPRLTAIEISPNQAAHFYFDLSLADQIELKEWKHFAFKIPRRKRYKDLDKQVVQFVEQEATPLKKINHDTIEEGDWACIEIRLLGQNKTDLPYPLNSFFWVKIKKSEIPDQFKRLLLNKKIGESFVTYQLDLDNDIHEVDDRYYNFLVTIIAISKGSHLSLDIFKQSFKLKNKLEIHSKLIEVFSFRNDLSQRKAIIEEMFTLFLTKHRFEIPKHLVLRRQEDILLVIMKQPDYHVYKAQTDFFDQIETLAEKQLKEEILIDQISYNENIKVDLRDVQQYLHFFNNKRLKEFIYFKPTFEKIEEIEDPLNASVLAQAVMREKTLNTIIYTLTH